MAKIPGGALVLRKFIVSTSAGKSDEAIVEIEGRKPGLIAWLLTAMGIDATTSLVITRRDITFRAGSFFGEMNSMMPMTAVATAHGGYSKPVEYLIAAGGLLLGGLGMLGEDEGWLGLVFLIGAGFFAAMYSLEKRMALSVESSGGAVFGLVFKRSLIEGVAVDVNKVKEVIAIIREMALAAQASR